MMRGVQLSDGSILMLVVGHTMTPCGRIIQRSYRGMAVRDYYEQALADRDTTGHPSCRTDGGRVVYGGGGIWPDVMLPAEPPVPAWLDRLRAAAAVDWRVRGRTSRELRFTGDFCGRAGAARFGGGELPGLCGGAG
jgi:carboxyl-terminal processing protease